MVLLNDSTTLAVSVENDTWVSITVFKRILRVGLG